MKFIIFGVGKLYGTYCTEDIKKNVIAYVDNKKNGETFCGKPFILPEQIGAFEFDYIVIFSTKYFEEIYLQLWKELNIDREKIISYCNLISYKKEILRKESLGIIAELSSNFIINRILDINGIFSEFCYHKNGVMKLANTEELTIDVIWNEKRIWYPILENLYDSRFLGEDKLGSNTYDAVILMDLCRECSAEQGKEILLRFKRRARYLFVNIPYPYRDRDRRWFELDLSMLGTVIYEKCCENEICIVIDTEGNNYLKTAKIYIVSHKKFKCPQDLLYRPIYVGGYGKKKEFSQSDGVGENIAQYNEAINEITALYWIWKHAEEEYVGLCHYRRYFLQRAGGREKLQLQIARNLLERYDIILPEEKYVGDVKEQLKNTVDQKAFEEGWDIISKFIQEKHPRYMDAFSYVFSGTKMYPCNMFITKKKIIDPYCEWLFDFILPAADAMDISGYDNYSKRILGFITERLFSVWLIGQKLKIKEMPLLLTEPGL